MATKWWVWTWGPQESPAQVSNFGDNPVFDVLRVILIILAGLLISYSLRAVVEQRRREMKMSIYQQMRFVSLAIFAFILAANEAWLAGTPATPRLVISYVAVALGIMGVYGKRKQQKTETIDTDQDLT